MLNKIYFVWNILSFIVTSTCELNCDFEWIAATTTGPNASSINIEYVVNVTNDNIDGTSYQLLALLSWKPAIVELDFDGYIVNYEVIPSLEFEIPVCFISGTDIYTEDETVLLYPLRFNYQYVYEIKVANKLKNVTTLGDGTKDSSSLGADCYQSTSDYEYCSTLEPQYPCAPADVNVSSVTTSTETSITVSWLRPRGPNAEITKAMSIRTAKQGYLDDASASEVTLVTIGSDQVIIDDTERFSTILTRTVMTPGIRYDLRIIGLNAEGKGGIPTVVSFTVSPPSSSSSSTPTEQTPESLPGNKNSHRERHRNKQSRRKERRRNNNID